MKITKKTEIVFERERSVKIRFGGASAELFCRRCRRAERFLTIDEAAVLKHSSAREIFRLVEAGRVHFAETASGSLLVCLASLAGTENQTDLIEIEK